METTKEVIKIKDGIKQILKDGGFEVGKQIEEVEILEPANRIRLYVCKCDKKTLMANVLDILDFFEKIGLSGGLIQSRDDTKILIDAEYFSNFSKSYISIALPDYSEQKKDTFFDPQERKSELIKFIDEIVGFVKEVDYLRVGFRKGNLANTSDVEILFKNKQQKIRFWRILSLAGCTSCMNLGKDQGPHQNINVKLPSFSFEKMKEMWTRAEEKEGNIFEKVQSMPAPQKETRKEIERKKVILRLKKILSHYGLEEGLDYTNLSALTSSYVLIKNMRIEFVTKQEQELAWDKMLHKEITYGVKKMEYRGLYYLQVDLVQFMNQEKFDNF